MNRLSQPRVPANLVSLLRCRHGSGQRIPTAQWERDVEHLHVVALRSAPVDVNRAVPCGMRLSLPEATVHPEEEEL